MRQRVKQMLLHECLVFGDERRLSIHETAIVNNTYFNLSSGRIVVEPYASIAHHVSLITGTHDFTKLNRARQTTAPSEGRDITVKRGAFICSNSTILGPCVIGEHAVIAAGSVVTSDVSPHSLVAGVPARFINWIEPVDSSIPPVTETQDSPFPLTWNK